MLVQLYSGEIISVVQSNFISDTAFYTQLTKIFDTQNKTHCPNIDYSDNLIRASVGLDVSYPSNNKPVKFTKP
jgi:hypothetical protein